ncbi:MAG: chemotaxis protein CheA [Planctomycetes bacterium]|nr:chemotaxis protein CheA [Planctomycetota bacterium]
MPLSEGIDRLHRAAERLRHGGRTTAATLVAELAALRQFAESDACDDLARLCRVGAEAVQQICADEATFQQHGEAAVQHLERVEQYARALVLSRAQGGDGADLVPPPLLTVPDPEDEKHFLETVGVFVGHALGTLSELEDDILLVESAPDQNEAVGAIRRVVHTLKAEFGVLNMTVAQKLCHQAETAIDASTDSGRAFPVDVMLEIADWLRQYLDRLTKDAHGEPPVATSLLEKLRLLIHTGAAPTPAPGAPPAAPAELVELQVGGEFADSLAEFITESRSHLTEAEGAMIAFEADHSDAEQINLTFRAFHTIKGVAGFLNLKAIVELAHVSETLLDEARSHRLEFRQQDVDLILAAGDLISQMIAALEGQPAPKKAQFETLVKRLQAAAQRVHVENGAEEVLEAAPSHQEKIAQKRASPAKVKDDDDSDGNGDGKVLKPAPRASSNAGGAGGAPVDEHKAAKVERTVKVSTTRLDMLVDMVGELVIAQSMVLQDPAIQRIDNQGLARNIGQVGKITRDLQEAAMSLRMVTLKATFQKMARLVRDVASKSGKKVALAIQGEDTELDRNVVEQISDPLVHMIRNAVDHGIEGPDDRRMAGKDSEGRLFLRAYHQGGSIVIEIADDGRGINKARVVAKAIEKGLLPAETRSEDLSDQEAFGIIFLPGFSTAEKVTDLSGRGVGMDVVRRNIEALRGKIEIDSKLGEGTTFRMRLPLTLAIIDGMVVRVGRERYVVPTLSIEQSFRPATADVHHLVDRGECVRVRGNVLPVYRLKDIFAQGDGFDDLEQGILIVVEIDGERSCLFVDEILGQQQVVIKSLGMQGEKLCGVSGGAIMSDGRIALILDVGSLVEAAVAVQ